MPMTIEKPTTHGDLPAARNKLHHAINQLIDPQPTTHNGQIHYADSLYDQLSGEVPAGNIHRANAAKSRPPMWIDASDLLKEINTTIRGWQPDPYTAVIFNLGARIITTRITENPTIRRLRLLQEHTWRPQDTPHVLNIATQIERFALKIRTLFTEKHTKHLPAPCPACNVQTVYRTDAAGERVRQPALQITSTADGQLIGCQCQNCRHIWAPSHFTHLARVLGYKLPEGVLE